MATKDRENQQSESREMQRNEERQPARRGYDPLGFSPSEFFANPFAVMRRMHDEMDRMFAGALGRQTGSSAMGGLSSWAPAVEVSEKDNELSVCAELPGLKPEDVKIEVTDEALVIQGERRHEHKEEQGGRFHTERSYGRFYRAVPLPEGANTENARAEFKNGELRVSVPIERPQHKRRQVPISGSGTQENK